jgi:uncharacterized repeat protein (TIGR03803 family)
MNRTDLPGLLLRGLGIFILVSALASTTFGQAKETVLYSFGASPIDAAEPTGGLLLDSAGNIYGTTFVGGSNCQDLGGCGTVYELSPSAGGWTETVLYNFCTTGDPFTCPDGAEPAAGLIWDDAGNLYGTTQLGGTGYGTVFELTRPLAQGGSWTEMVIWAFGGPKKGDGASPYLGKLHWDTAGNLYDTTGAGGAYNRGTVYELSLEAGGGWNETILHSFRGDDGAIPFFGVVVDGSGNLYGTTNEGGIVNGSSCPNGCGTVFELSPSGNGWSESVYKFNGKTGTRPYSPLSGDELGSLYGTTEYGGEPGCDANGCGGVFKFSPNGTGGWTLHTFLFDGQDGGNPETGVVIDSKTGTQFGTTEWGDNVFMIQGNKETVLYQFCSQPNCEDGSNPQGGLLLLNAGQLYGTTLLGGANQAGVVFTISR